MPLERLGESGATHDSQSASRSGVEAWVARNLNGWDDSDAGLSQAWVRCPSGLASLHHSRLSTRSSYQLYSFSGDRRFCYDNHRSFVYDSPNLFCGPSGSVRTGLTAVRSEPGHRTHLTSLLCVVATCGFFFFFFLVCVSSVYRIIRLKQRRRRRKSVVQLWVFCSSACYCLFVRTKCERWTLREVKEIWIGATIWLVSRDVWDGQHKVDQ